MASNGHKAVGFDQNEPGRTWTRTLGSTDIPGASRRLGSLIGIHIPIERDLHRNPLHDFDEIAGGVLGGDDAEARAGAHLYRLHRAVKFFIGIGIDSNGHGLAGRHFIQLRFLEIRRHPHI